jgi:glycosyltransferase involved in cell wall biosynthesis
MRILHVSDCYLPRLGGIETQVHGLAQRQLAAGHRVEVMTATPRARHDRTRTEVIDGVPLRRITVDLPFELPVHPNPGRQIRPLLRAGGYDVVHVHAGVVSPFAFAVAPVHSLWGYATPAFRLLDAVGRWTSWPVAWSAVSEVAARPVRRLVGPDRRVDVLPNGIDVERWQVDPLPRDPDDVLIVAVMRLAPRKRPLPLLRMLRDLREQVPRSVRLRASIVGEGPQRPAMERRSRRYGTADWVELPGRFTRDQLRELYRRADVFVAPANLESFGIAALEARTAGLPVVAKAAAGIGEFVTPGVEGLLAATDPQMVAAIALLAGSPARRQEISRHNRQVPPSMAWPQVLQRCELAYRRARELAG